MAARRRFNAAVKRLALARCKDDCEGCGHSLKFRRFAFDHVVPFEISRDSSAGNCQVLCVDCHLAKTIRDVADIAKVHRIAEKRIGLKGPGRGRSPMRAGKRSKERKTFNHGVIARTTQAQEYRRMIAERYPEGMR